MFSFIPFVQCVLRCSELQKWSQALWDNFRVLFWFSHQKNSLHMKHFFFETLFLTKNIYKMSLLESNFHNISVNNCMGTLIHVFSGSKASVWKCGIPCFIQRTCLMLLWLLFMLIRIRLITAIKVSYQFSLWLYLDSDVVLSVTSHSSLYSNLCNFFLFVFCFFPKLQGFWSRRPPFIGFLTESFNVHTVVYYCCSLFHIVRVKLRPVWQLLWIVGSVM